MYTPIQFINGTRPNRNIEYREYSPSPSLSAHVACFWTVNSVRVLKNDIHRVLADGCADIICDLRGGNAFMTGIADRTEFLRIGGPIGYFGIRFLPTAVPFLLKDRASGSLNANIDFDESFGFLKEMTQRIFEAENTHYRIRIAQWYLEKFFTGYTIKPVFDSLLRHALDTGGMISVRGMSDYHGLSEKQIGRHFIENIDMTTKPFLRVIRFQNAYRHFAYQKHSSINQALDAGYYDQSHLIKEMNYFLGDMRNIF
jgi:AraC-like DNA-binding protein